MKMFFKFQILNKIPDRRRDLDEVSNKIIKFTNNYKNTLRHKLISLPQIPYAIDIEECNSKNPENYY